MDEHESGTAGSGQQTRTGIASVDAVLDQVSGLDQRPVAEHVAAFERAHEQLRRALDADPEA